ncbi:hypothetical protein L7F22_031568 [Adiantum nelumboides]|nr:hypothetical protein [Adiantum nelumboides]
MDPSSSQVYSRRDRPVDFKRQHVDSVHVNDMADSDSQYVFDALHEKFSQSRSHWNKHVPTLKYKMKLPSIVSPLRKSTQSTVIIFFSGRLPSANDVAQWIKSILGGCFIEREFFASRGFYEVHLTDHMYKHKLLQASPLFYRKQMVHVLLWSPSKDYQNLIRHSCPVWVEVVNFLDYMREELPGLAASLGNVICPPRPTRNKNRFCILWDTDKPTPPSIAIEVEDVEMGETYFDLKWEVFAGACFTCHKFGHLASECPQVVHKPPPNAIPQSNIVLGCLLIEKAKPSGSAVSDANLKSAPQLVAQSSKAKDKGKALMADAKKTDLNDHAPLWLEMLFDMSRTEDALRSRISTAVTSRMRFSGQLVVTAKHPLFMHAHADIEFAWYSFVECVRHYARLFATPAPLSASESYARLQFLEVVSPIMDSDEATALEQPFTNEELYHALKALGKGKVPGYDGLTAEFFHAFWNELKDALLLMINSAWLEQQLPSSWKQGLLKLLPKKHLAENFDDWRPITLMPVIYKLVAKMLVHRVREILHRGLHPHRYGFIPRRHILDNIAIAMIAIEYAKYSSQDVVVLQVGIAKAFDSVRWDFISQIMSRLGFGPKWINLIYWMYSEATSRAIIADGLSDPRELGRSVRQGCPLSALLYAISTHPLLLYVDKMVDTGLLHGVQIPGSPPFLPQAYADDSFFMPKNDRADLQTLMKILSDFGLAAGLHINFKKSILLPLNSCDWHSILWLGQLLSPHDVIRHLGYPIGWFITVKQQMEWVTAKLTQKLRYWKLSTWPLHVRLRIVQSIVMAHAQFYLPLLSWTHKDISAFMSQAMELLWKTHSKRKALRLLRMQSTCRPRSHGGLNILNLHFHLLARKATLLADFFAQVQPWSRMLAAIAVLCAQRHIVIGSLINGKLYWVALKVPYLASLTLQD